LKEDDRFSFGTYIYTHIYLDYIDDNISTIYYIREAKGVNESKRKTGPRI
jgi:hypothetical protein